MEKFSKKLNLTKEIPNTKYNMVEISLTHSHGGVSYFDYSQQKAGYYIHFRPMTVSKSERGYECCSFALFDKPEYSYKINIYNKYRKSAKKMEELWKIVENNMDKIFEAWETLTPMNVYKLLNNLFSQYMNKGDC